MTAAGPQLDPDRVLALSYVGSARPALSAVWHLDAALGAVLSSGREPMISRIKLAWWRDSLEKLDSHSPPAEPVLEELARTLPGSVNGSDLAAMEAGWAALLDPEELSKEELDTYASRRGGLLFCFSAALLGGEASPAVAKAGEAWALTDLARHGGNQADIEAAAAAARDRIPQIRWPARLRPLGMLAVLAARDLDPARPRWERQGAPARMFRMLRHRVTGF